MEKTIKVIDFSRNDKKGFIYGRYILKKSISTFVHMHNSKTEKSINECIVVRLIYCRTLQNTEIIYMVALTI